VNRAKYWIGFGIAYGMMFLSFLPLFWLEPENVYWGVFAGLWILVWTVTLFAVATKRLHDLDISGWWLLGFMFLPTLLEMWAVQVIHMHLWREIGGIALSVGIIWLGSAKGTEGSNRFGPDPIPRTADKGDDMNERSPRFDND
jgi:uncharacterized membrane protein YhaH (DUF805 family)